MDLQSRIERDFTYHPPTQDSIWKLQALRNHAKVLALLIESYSSESREQSLAITHLEQAVMWANAGIVRNQTPEKPAEEIWVPAESTDPFDASFYGSSAVGRVDPDQLKLFEDPEPAKVEADPNLVIDLGPPPISAKAQEAIDKIKAIVASHQETRLRGGCGKDGGCGNCRCARA